jgi:glycosyltransferase involved in cell wall biosynthesis
VRILICASDLPLRPLNTGFRRQLDGLLPALGARNEVRLVGYRMPEQVMPKVVDARMHVVHYRRPNVLGNVADVAAAALSGRPLRAARLAGGLRPALHEELAAFDPDVVHVGPGKLAGLLGDLGGRPAVLGVMDTWHLNVEARVAASSGLRRAVLAADVKRIKRWEASRYRGWDRIVPSNEDDLAVLRSLDPTLPFALIPIGFDASAYAPDPAATRDPNRIMFHGAMDYPPNVEAVEYIANGVLPKVRAQRAEAHLVIVGRDPAPRVRALTALPGVTVTGEVEDMRAELTKSRVWVGPFVSGTGIKTKLLEAMATDLPCVVTPTGARGLELDSGAFLVGSTGEDLAAHVITLLDDDGRAAGLGRAGGDYVRARYDWPVVAHAFERLYEEVIAEKRGTASRT